LPFAVNDDLTPVERSWLAALLRHLSERDSWLMGTYAEHVVADALAGAKQSVSTFAAWDLDWEKISIEVKCSTERQTGVVETDRPSAEKWDVRTHYAWDHEAGDWHPGEKKHWADVYVLARHEGFNHRAGWSFYVVPSRWFDDRGTITVTGALLRAGGWGPHPPSGLPEAVREAKRRQLDGAEERTTPQ
jgi:hypothetical protein